MLSAGFSLLSLNSRGSPGNRHVRTAPVPVPGRLRRIPVGGSCSGSFSSPSSRSWSPFLSESWAGAGRAAAALTAPRLRLPSVPVVTCSRCSHNSAMGRREMPRGRVNPWFLPLTLPLPPLAALFLYIPSQLHSQRSAVSSVSTFAVTSIILSHLETVFSLFTMQ